MEKSLWGEDIALPEFKKLDQDITTDVLVVGGGICGILCAYLLKQKGISCILLEKNRIARRTTLNTTAKITSLHGIIYSDLINNFGKETAKKYFDINEYAINQYEKLSKHIPCDFKRLTSNTYTLNNPEKIEEEVNALFEIGASAELKYNSELPFNTKGMVSLKNQAKFNPLKFIKDICKDLDIYENSPVSYITSQYAVCENYKVFSKKTIVATHFPFINKHGSYFLKMFQHRSYVIALENAQNFNEMYVDENDTGLSFRDYNGLLLMGGLGGRTGEKCESFNELIRLKNIYYPKSKIKFQWATQDCISLDKLPYIGKYSPNTPNLYVATGFNKWGMSLSMVAAIILSDMVQDIKNDYADIFSPSRNMIKPQLFINGAKTLKNFLNPKTKRCPHLGCALNWNKAEHTWDCPCHGSRFEKDGSLIDNPATKDANI